MSLSLNTQMALRANADEIQSTGMPFSQNGLVTEEEPSCGIEFV